MALNPNARPAINVRMLSRFPSLIVGTTGIAVTTAGGIATVKMNVPGLTENNSTTAGDRVMVSYDPASGEHEKIRLDAFEDFFGAQVTAEAEAARDAAEGFRDEAEGFRDSAQTIYNNTAAAQTPAFVFSTTTTDSDPGNGNVRFNNATLASVTFIYFDNQDNAANSVTGWLDTMANKGIITVTPVATPGARLMFQITGGAVDGTGYRKVPVTFLSGGALPANAAVLAFTFNAAGVDGAAGTSTAATVRAASTANITLASALINGSTVDGVVLATSDLVLVKNQTLPEQNGIYTVVAAGAASRSTGFTTWNNYPGAQIAVQEGAISADTLYLCTSNKGGTLGTTAIAFTPGIRIDSRVPNGTLQRWLDIVALYGGTTVTAGTQAALLTVEKQLHATGLINKVVRLNLRCGSDAIAARIPFVARPGVGFVSDSGTLSSFSEATGLTGFTLDTGVTLQQFGGGNGYNVGMGVYTPTETLGVTTGYMLGPAASSGISPAQGSTAFSVARWVTWDLAGSVTGDNGQVVGGGGVPATVYTSVGSTFGVRSKSGFGFIMRNQIALNGSSVQTDPDATLVVPTSNILVTTTVAVSCGEWITEALTQSEAAMLGWIIEMFQVAMGRNAVVEGLIS